MNPQDAEAVFRDLFESYKRICACVNDVFEHGSYPQAMEFRKLGGQFMGEIVFGFFNPLLAEYPYLEPEEFKAAEPQGRETLPESTAQNILTTVAALEAQLDRLTTEHLGAVPPEESDHYQRSSEELRSSIALARDFVTRAMRQ